jgi:hypothetical protein
MKQYKIIDSHDFSDCPVFISMDQLRLNNSLIIGCFENDNIVSIFVLIIKNKFFIKIGESLYKPFPIDTQEIIDGFISFIADNNFVDFLLPSPSHTPFEYYPKNSIKCNFGTYLLDLTQSKELLLSKMHQKHRNVIRNVAKKDFLIVENDLESVYQLFKDTMSRSNMSYPSLESLKKYLLLNDGSIYCATLWYDNLPQAAVWIKIDNLCAYYIHGGTLSKPLTGAMNYLHWHTILLMQKKGIKQYNFVGARINPIKNSKIEGMQRFKKRFGAELEIGFMWKIIFNSSKYSIYIFLIKIYSILTGKKYQIDIIDQELKKTTNS